MIVLYQIELFILMQESFQVFCCLEYLILGCRGTLVNYVDVNYAQVKSHNKVNIPISKCASAKASFLNWFPLLEYIIIWFLIFATRKSFY